MKDKLIIILMVVLIVVLGFMCYIFWNMNNTMKNLITKGDLEKIKIKATEHSGNPFSENAFNMPYTQYTITVQE